MAPQKNENHIFRLCGFLKSSGLNFQTGGNRSLCVFVKFYKTASIDFYCLHNEKKLTTPAIGRNIYSALPKLFCLRVKRLIVSEKRNRQYQTNRMIGSPTLLRITNDRAPDACELLVKGRYFPDFNSMNPHDPLEGKMTVFRQEHPLIKHKLGIIREKNISTKEFREICSEIAAFLTYEATRDLEIIEKTIEGWAGTVNVGEIKGKKITIAPVLRAGLGMMNGVFDLIPSAKVSVLGFYRNEKTLEPVEYYVKTANKINERIALILDPMLATGGTFMAAIEILKNKGCEHIKGLFLVASPEGLKKVEEKHPDVDIYVAAIDEKLNDMGYILPGLGDAGDKIFGTK